MSSIVVKRFLWYELKKKKKEGTLFYSDPIVIIRKEGFTEIYNLQKHAHETGDTISKKITRKTIYEFIEDNLDLFSM